MHKFVIRGTRGSAPACGRNFLKYGGNTTCLSLETDQGIIVFDTGTGITSLGSELACRPEIPPITVLYTHFHLDHVIGLPSFAPLYNPKVWMSFMGDPDREDDWRTSLRTLIANPYWPTDLPSTGASKCFESLPVEQHSMMLYGVGISWCQVFHPQRCLAYKIDAPDATIVLATDHEHSESDLSAGFLEFCRGVDFLIYDAMYTPEEYPERTGWGHGNWQQGVQLAMEANAGELILTHHDSSRTDSQVDEIVRLARNYFPKTRAAMENMVLTT